jgi:hypothetical protein
MLWVFERRPIAKLQPTGVFMLLGLTNGVFHRSIRCSAFCRSLTFIIEPKNKISTLVLRSAAVAGGDE